MEKHIEIKDFALAMGVCYAQARKLVESGVVKAVDMGVGKLHIWRIPESEVERFKQNRSNIKNGDASE